MADLLYPQWCVGCRRLARGGICRSCLAELPRLGPEVCRRCGAPAAVAVADCRECRGRRFAFDAARQAVSFTSSVREAILRLKYRSERALAEALSLLVAEIAAGLEPRPVTWVPSGPRRLRERGFDHARLLAEACARRMELPVAPLLVRVRETPPQVGLEPAVRRKNLERALRCPSSAPPAVLVIDDVFTTGATASEAARALKAAGALHVTVLCLARALPPGRAPPRSLRRSSNARTLERALEIQSAPSVRAGKISPSRRRVGALIMARGSRLGLWLRGFLEAFERPPVHASRRRKDPRKATVGCRAWCGLGVSPASSPGWSRAVGRRCEASPEWIAGAA
jgi:competence protein ComFC